MHITPLATILSEKRCEITNRKKKVGGFMVRGFLNEPSLDLQKEEKVFVPFEKKLLHLICN